MIEIYLSSAIVHSIQRNPPMGVRAGEKPPNRFKLHERAGIADEKGRVVKWITFP